jgi:hypothetical protein
MVRPSERMAGFPATLETIIMKALERNPDDRFATAEARAEHDDEGGEGALHPEARDGH